MTERDLIVGTCGNPLVWREGKWYTHHSYGTIVRLIAPRVKQVVCHGPVLPEESAHKADCELRDPNITVHRWGTWYNTLRALRRPDRLLRQYWSLTKGCDALFIRGTHPLNWTLHWMARARGQRIVHWIAANSVQIIRSNPRGYGRLIEFLGLCFAYFERVMIRLSAKVSGGYLVTSGLELADVFRSKRTVGCASSSTTSEKDFLVREDTCTGETIRVMFLGFIRVEKGIEFLLRALPHVESDRPVQLALVGGWDQFPGERERLVHIIEELGITDRVSWEGYAKFGPDLFAQIDRSDMLVLPSLSEGTPHVLIEARARSLPIIASQVGGIPDSVCDGEDGLLVPPRRPKAIAEAISRIIADQTLRQRLIRQGRERVRKLTIEWFVDLIMNLITRPASDIPSDFADTVARTDVGGCGA